MAKQYFKVKSSSNFSFKRLSEKFEDIIGEQDEKIIDGLAQMTKRNISEGKLRGLSQNTLELRRRGLSTFDSYGTPNAPREPKPTGETRPPLYTGNLLNSIKPTKDGIEMLGYGEEHNDGFNTPEGKFVPARTFIPGKYVSKKDKKGLEKIQNELVINMQKVMKTHGGKK